MAAPKKIILFISVCVGRAKLIKNSFSFLFKYCNAFVVQRLYLPTKANRHNRHSMHAATTSESGQCQQSPGQCLAAGFSGRASVPDD